MLLTDKKNDFISVFICLHGCKIFFCESLKQIFNATVNSHCQQISSKLVGNVTLLTFYLNLDLIFT